MPGFLLFLTGLGLLIAAAEMVVRGAARLALALGISPFVLGLTVVALGTSMPELAVGITAAKSGAGGLAVGNIAGTNMVNILFILGLSALMRPIVLHDRAIKLDLPMIVFASALTIVLAWDEMLSRRDGMVMFGCAVLYTASLIYSNTRRAVSDDAAMAAPRPATRPADLLLLLAGIALSILGADWLVSGATTMARSFSVPDVVIGLTIVAIGTSGPELITTIVTTLKNQRDVAVGNLLGSSTYNILVILGITCMVSPAGIAVERQLLTFDIPLMLALAILCIPVFISGRGISRIEGGFFLALYVGYLGWLLLFRT